MSNTFGNKKLNVDDSYLTIKARFAYNDDNNDNETFYYFPGGGPADISKKIYMPSDEPMKEILKKIFEAGNENSSYQLVKMDVFTSLSDADLKKTIPKWVETATGIVKRENDLHKKIHGTDGKLRILFKYKKKCVNLLNRNVVNENDIVLEL